LCFGLYAMFHFVVPISQSASRLMLARM
jgi:hypothetical protein